MNEVQTAETGGFRTNQRTAEFKSFSGECSRKLTGQLLVHTEHITYFATAYTDITGRYIHIRTQVAPQFQHKCLAETHDFRIALATGGEVRTAFTATHRKRSQCILECLLEAEEFQNRKVDGSMETDTAFVRTDSVVELYTITEIGLNFPSVVYPSDTESEDTIRLYQSFDDLGFFKFGMLIVYIFD